MNLPVTKLRVLARGTALVNDFDKLEGSRLNVFLGWDCMAIGPEVVDRFVDPQLKRVVENRGPSAVFVKRVGEVCEVNDRKEYRLAVRDGDLWPADLATAQTCGVKFDPRYGGEHDVDVKQATAKAVSDLKSAKAA